jgi:hypothetical protein
VSVSTVHLLAVFICTFGPKRTKTQYCIQIAECPGGAWGAALLRYFDAEEFVHSHDTAAAPHVLPFHRAMVVLTRNQFFFAEETQSLFRRVVVYSSKHGLN